ncbi:MAG: 30S ribosomal protein S13 [Candidatus Diapherotrites archaeon]
MSDEEKKSGKEIRYIVRIANKDLNGNLPICQAIIGLRGIGHRTGRIIAAAFEDKSGIKYNIKLGDIPEEKDKELEDIVINPQNYGIPSWTFNKQKEYESGENIHLVMGDLEFSLRKDLQRLKEIKSYRGFRHTWGLPLRGQKTKSTHRGKGGTVGVIKKDAKGGKSAASGAAGVKAGGSAKTGDSGKAGGGAKTGGNKKK